MKDNEIPALVRRLRESMSLTQEQFAHAVGVTYSTVNQWENGHRRPQPYLLNRLLEMEVSLQEETTHGTKRRAKRKIKRER